MQFTALVLHRHSWCGPCKMLSPILEKLTADPSVKSGSGRPVDLVTVDTDTETELAMKYKVVSQSSFLIPWILT